jgi:antitoxin PrlF
VQQAQAQPARSSKEAQLQDLDGLAAGGYITPQEYKDRRKAVLDSMLRCRPPADIGLRSRTFSVTFDVGKEIPYHKDIPYTAQTSMIISKLTTKSQTTIPQPVRTALHLGPGDALAYQIDDGRVILTKAKTGGQTDDPFGTFDEWNSEADAKGYAKL